MLWSKLLVSKSHIFPVHCLCLYSLFISNSGKYAQYLHEAFDLFSFNTVTKHLLARFMMSICVCTFLEKKAIHFFTILDEIETVWSPKKLSSDWQAWVQLLSTAVGLSPGLIRSSPAVKNVWNILFSSKKRLPVDLSHNHCCGMPKESCDYIELAAALNGWAVSNKTPASQCWLFVSFSAVRDPSLSPPICCYSLWGGAISFVANIW